ncbi:MAG: ABC transporter permease [Bacillota bacterium]|jgi:spermidine/putrescine transport system permease protein
MKISQKKRLGKAGKIFYMSLVFLFLYAPIAVLIVYSFNASEYRGHWGGFTFDWYKSLFANETIMNALYYTLLIAVLAAVISTVIGTAAAMAISKLKKTPRALVMNTTYLPVLNPDIVTGVALMMLFIFMRIPFGSVSLLLAHVTFCVPYVVLSVLPKLSQLKPNLFEAALDLGATPFTAFRKVMLPNLMPGIVTGAIFAFTLSLDDFVISFFTTGNGVQNLSIAIYAMARKGVSPEVNAVSTLLFLAVLILLMIVNWRTAKESSEN